MIIVNELKSMVGPGTERKTGSEGTVQVTRLNRKCMGRLSKGKAL